MALETATYIGDLVSTNPVGATDKVKQGDDHIRLIKAALQATLPKLVGKAWRVQAKSAGYTVVGNDNMTVFNCTAALTLSLTAAATLGNGFLCFVFANGGAVTIDPNGAETVGGAATLSIADGEAALVFCNGTTFFAAKMPWITVTQAEAEAGTGTTGRMWTPQRVAQAIAALTPPVTALGLTDGGTKYSSFSAQVSRRYNHQMTADGTIYGPASATVQDVIAIVVGMSFTSTFNPNGLKINGSTSALTLPNGSITILTYTGTTDGWL